MSQSRGLSRRQFLIASTGISVGALLAACAAPAPAGQPGGEAAAPAAAKTQVLVWDGFGADATAVDQMVATFNERNPEIEVVREAQSAMRDILRTALDAGAGPDIM